MKLNIQSQGRGYPLVLFHGWGFDHKVWRACIDTLQDKFHVYAVDLPGFGQSSMMEWTRFKFLLLQALPQKFAVCGWSLGGFFATRLALEVPDSVSHLLNIASSPRFTSQGGWPGVKPDILDGFYEQLKQDPVKTLENFIKMQWKEFELNSMPGMAGMQSGLEILSGWDLRGDLDRASVPVCYMFGRLDLIVPRATMTIMQKKYPQFQYYLFEHAGHTPFLTHQSLFLSKLEEFIL